MLFSFEDSATATMDMEEKKNDFHNEKFSIREQETKI